MPFAAFVVAGPLAAVFARVEWGAELVDVTIVTPEEVATLAVVVVFDGFAIGEIVLVEAAAETVAVVTGAASCFLVASPDPPTKTR